MTRPRITYANVMATIALFIAIGGTAAAAVQLTGARIKDGSLTGRDVKNDSLGTADLSAKARASLRGDAGRTGATGARGATGLKGPTGAQGPRGSAAFMTSAFAHRDTGLVKQRLNTSTPNDGPGATGTDWDSLSYASASAGGAQPQLATPGTYESIPLTGAWTTVLALTGMTGSDAARSSDTLLSLTFTDGYLDAATGVTLLHRNDGEDLATNDPASGTLRHGRAECGVFAGTSSDPAALTTQVGASGWTSSGAEGVTHELVQVAMNATTGPLTSGMQYNVAVKCRDADYTGATQWQVASGNLTAFISR